MSHTEIRFKRLITRLQEHFREHQYGFGVTWNYPVAARRFLRDLERQGLELAAVTSTDVERYLDALRMKRRRGLLPDHPRRMHRASIHMLLRLVQGEWPAVAAPASDHERATQAMVMSFDTWMTELRGLSPNTAKPYRLMYFDRGGDASNST
jgi:integrase/recombinase XerD